MSRRHNPIDRDVERVHQHPRPAATQPSGLVGGLAGLQRSVGNKAVVALVASRAPVPVQRQQTGGCGPRSEEAARALVDPHVVPRDCFIELESSRAGWRPIIGTGCAHWVAHQRGGPQGNTAVCQARFKYRVRDVLASLYLVSGDLQGARVGYVWSAPAGQSHIGIVRAVTRDPATNAVVSVEVENDSSASGGVVTQTKTSGSIYG